MLSPNPGYHKLNSLFLLIHIHIIGTKLPEAVFFVHRENQSKIYVIKIHKWDQHHCWWSCCDTIRWLNYIRPYVQYSYMGCDLCRYCHRIKEVKWSYRICILTVREIIIHFLFRLGHFLDKLLIIYLYVINSNNNASDGHLEQCCYLFSLIRTPD